MPTTVSVMGRAGPSSHSHDRPRRARIRSPGASPACCAITVPYHDLAAGLGRVGRPAGSEE